MKKILLSSLLALGTFANAQCDPITTFPQNYNFEDVTTPALPACWTVASSGNGNNWNTYTGDGNNGTTAGDKLLNNPLPAGAVGSAWVFTQAFNMTGGEPYSGAFNYWANNNTNNRVLSIGYGTSPTDAAMNIFGTDASLTLTKETSAFVFTPPTTGTYYIGIKVHNTAPNASQASVLVSSLLIKKENLSVSDVNSKKISAYPNPVKDILKLSDIKGVKSITVTDMSGRQVKTLTPNTELNLSSLKAGNYVVSLIMENGSIQTINTIKK